MKLIEFYDETVARRSRKGVATGALALTLAAGLASGCDAEELSCNVIGTHVVEPGGTAFALAQELNDGDVSINDTLNEIRAVNPDVSLGHLQIGDKLNIPGDCSN